jgi:hypothetical protein
VSVSAIADRSRLGGDVVVGFVALTEGLGTDLASLALRVRKSSTALRWKESAVFAVLLSSVSFVVGAVWRDGRVWSG